MKRLVLGLVILFCVTGGLYAQDEAIELVFLVDNSGSMKANDPVAMRVKILSYLPEVFQELNLKITIFSFDSMVSNLGSIDKDADVESISNITFGVDSGGNYTDYSKALYYALEYLDESSADYKSIVLITDGELDVEAGDTFYPETRNKWQQAVNLIDDSIEKSATNDISIFSMLLSSDVSTGLLEEMAEDTDGEFYFVNTKTDVDGAFTDLMTALVDISGELAIRSGASRDTVSIVDEDIQARLNEFKRDYGFDESDDLEAVSTNAYEVLLREYNLLLQDYSDLEFDYRQLELEFAAESRRLERLRDDYQVELEEFEDGLVNNDFDYSELSETYIDDPGSLENRFLFIAYLIDNAQYLYALQLISETMEIAVPADMPSFAYGIIAKGYYYNAKFESLNELYDDMGSEHYLIPYYAGVVKLKLGSQETAKELFLESVESEDKFYGSHYNLGLIYFNEGRYEAALLELIKSMSAKETADAAFMIGNCYYSDGDSEQAAEYYEKAIEIDEEYYQAYHNLAVISVKNGDYLSAHEYIYSALRYNDEASDLYLLDGYIYYFSGNYWDAYINFSSANELGDDSAKIGMLLALIQADFVDDAYTLVNSFDDDVIFDNDYLTELYFTLNLYYGELSVVKADLNELLSREKVSSYYLLGNYYLLSGDDEQALEYYGMSLEYSQDSALAGSVMMEMTALNLQSSAEKKAQMNALIESIAEQTDQSTDEKKVLFQYFLSMREYDYSLEYLQLLLAEDSENAEFYLSLFYIVFPDEGVNNTVANLQERSENAENMDFMFYFSVFRQAMGMYELAIFGYDKVIEGSDSEDLIELAEKNKASCYIELEDWAEAIEIYERFEEKGDVDEYLYYNVASIYLRMQNVSYAKYYFKMALSINPELEEAFLNLFAIDLYYDNLEDVESYISLAEDMEIKNEDLFLYYKQLYYEKSGDLVTSAEMEEELITRFPDFASVFE